MSVEIGQKISHYEILEKIGEGGMGVVYKARDTSLNRFVALKFLPPHLTQLEENRERFIIEAQAASALDHNNICNIHEINESEDGQRFICMAYYEGESLRQKIKYGPIESDEAVAIVEQIARGLEAAHEQKIIHRDIKPGNIIITTRGNVKILDFGLAKLAGTELSRTTTSKGTAAYMCPEQIRGEKFDHRCDIWALGVLFYEMLTAHLPFDGDFPEPIMYAIVNENPKPLSNQLKNVPPFLQTILDILLEKDVERRYQNMSTLLQDLQSLKTNAHNPGILSKRTAKKIFTKKSFNLYAAIFISVTILFLFFYRTFIINEAGNGKLILVIPVENVFIGGDKPDFSDGITAMLINDLTQVSLLDVIHRNTAMQYKGTSKTPLEIHEELGIDYVVEPLIIQSGDQVKISATVFNASQNLKIGAVSFDGKYKEIFKLFSDLARSIVDKIDPDFIIRGKKQVSYNDQIDPRAFELYLQGYKYLNRWTKEDNNKAIDYFIRSLEIDSNFALPYVGLCHSYGQLTFWGEFPWEKGVPLIQSTIDKLLQVENEFAEAYQVLGAFRLWQLWDWEGAGEAFHRSIELNPNLSGFSGSEYSWYLIMMGHDDKAKTEAERLLFLDPLSYATRHTVNAVYYFSGQYDKAIEICQRTIELDPADWRPYHDIAANYEQMGMYEDAHEYRLSGLKISGESMRWLEVYDSLYAENPQTAYPAWMLMKYGKSENWFEKHPTNAAWIYASLGETNTALQWLRLAFAKKAGPMATLHIHPKWDMLREEPGFKDIIAKMNFPN